MLLGFEQLYNQPKILDFHKQFWGVPLPLVHTDLVHDPSAELSDYENGRENDGNLLPQSPPPIIDTNWMQILICAEYPRIYNWVEQKYEEGKEDRPAAVTVTGQPGIGQYNIIDMRSCFFIPSCA